MIAAQQLFGDVHRASLNILLTRCMDTISRQLCHNDRVMHRAGYTPLTQLGSYIYRESHRVTQLHWL